MPSQICDRKPCDHMTAAIGSLLKPNENGDRFEMIAKFQRTDKTVVLSLRYCPFCGTRIDEQWVENVKNNG